MESVDVRLRKELERLSEKHMAYLGYPLAKDFTYQALAPFLDLQINNVGDPYTPSSLGIDTKEIEQEVLDFFKGLLRAKSENTWGYVTNGGSEGNLYGLYLAKETFPKGMFYYSESTHYSVKKNLHLLGVQNIVIRAQDNGEIDYTDLEETLFTRRNRPAIFLLNIGTTMKEAIDDLSKIKAIIKKFAIKDYYIHCDAALVGAMAPFHSPRPAFDFQDGIDSISISGHKFIGSPVPCGVVLCKKEHSDRVAKSISYVGTKDTTITGSRNGLTPLILWYALKTLRISGLRKRYNDCLELAIYAERRMNEIGVRAWRNPNAVTVVFDQPSDTLCQKYQLAVEEGIVHILCMPGIDKQQIDGLIDDLKNDVREVISISDKALYQENEDLLAAFA
jgi:histidine decarboxylase